MNEIYDVLVIGCGPCGITVAERLTKANVKVAIVEGSTPGGKINIAPRVDNYPGYFQIPGPQLAMEFFKKVMDNNIEMIYDNVNELTKVGDIFLLKGDFDTYQAKKVVVATGTKERKIGLPKEDELLGHGISYCALCDGHFFKQKEIVVIGGGDSALKEAIHLAHIGSKVYVVHRRREFRGNDYLVDELKAFDNVEFVLPYIPLEILGEDKVTGVRLQNVETKEERIINCEGLFPLVGQIPNSQFIKIDGVLDEKGFIPVNEKYETSCPNLYAGGDVLPRDTRQIYIAVDDANAIADQLLK